MSRRGATFFPGTLLIAGAAALVTACPGLADTFVGEREALAAGQIWRLWTAHLAHFSGGHWAWSTLVWLAAGAWLERENRAAWWRVVLIGAPLVTTAALLGDGAMARYGGLSGLACAPLIWAGLRLLRDTNRTLRVVGGAILLGLVWKVTREWTNATPLLAEFSADAGEVRTAVWAHLAGAAVGAWAACCSRDEKSGSAAENIARE